MDEHGDICFREPTAADAEAVRELYRQLSPDTSNLQRDTPAVLSDPGSLCVLVQVDGHPAGVALCCVRTSLSAGRKMIIDDVVVDIQHRNKGLGLALMQHLIGLAKDKDLDCIELCCSLTKTRLHMFYEHLGFTHRMRMYSLFLK